MPRSRAAFGSKPSKHPSIGCVSYSHTQTSPGRIALAVLTFGLAYPFSSLTTTVADEDVTVAFRFGWPKRIIARSEITSIGRVRNKWWYGLGIRLIPGSSTMYNVWGMDAIQIGLQGSRNFRIGTDDPTGLAKALSRPRGCTS